MARADRFREQHNDLLAMASELQGLLNPAKLAQDGAAARTCLSKLVGKLSIHLTTEDQVLYPELIGNKDASVSVIAKRFSTEMKSTLTVVQNYNAKWNSPSAIKADPESFARETTGIIKTLADRIKRENQELYAAADKVEGKVFG